MSVDPAYFDVMTFTEPQVWHVGTDVIGGRPVKRYHLSRDAVPIDPAIEERAYAMVPGMFSPEDGETPPAAFTVLFRSGAGSHLNVYSWYWGNVIWGKFASGGVPFLGCPDEDPTNLVPLDHLSAVGCIYELGVLAHERSAWVRHMLMPEKPDLDGYLADLLPDGPIGHP